MLAIGSSHSSAQTSITPDQRKEYGRIFQASPEERRILLEAQEKRIAIPDSKRFKEFLESSPSFKAFKAGQVPELGALLTWNEVSLNATALDSTNPANSVPVPGAPTEPASFFGEQYGPPRTSRAMAMVHLAMFEAVNTISRKYQSYQNLQATIVRGVEVPVDEIAKASKDRAIIEAAYRTLIKLYPKKQTFFDNALDVSLMAFQDPNSPAVVLGALVGAQAAKAVLDLRYFDGSELPDLSSVDFSSGNPFLWHQDPISTPGAALGGNWWRVKPFLVPSGHAFRHALPGPPAYGSPAFIEAYKQVKRLGGDPNVKPADGERSATPTDRTGAKTPNNPTSPYNDDQTFVGIFWAYDGSAYLCAPPRMYNMISTSIALKEKPITNVEDFAHYLAFLNMTMADAAVVAWDAKYYYLYPRPVTLIRELKADDTPEGSRDPFWTPLGGQATNGVKSTRNLTPPFPAYPSGHAVFGGALFQALLCYFKAADPSFPDAGVAFEFISDEYNGLNKGPGNSNPRDPITAHFDSFKQAEKLNADSRIYLGVHWKYDADDGTKMGNAVGQSTFDSFMKKLPIPKK